MSITVVDKFSSSSNFEASVSGSHREKQMQPSAVNYGMHVGTVWVLWQHISDTRPTVRFKEGWRVGCSCRGYGFMAAYNQTSNSRSHTLY